MQNGGCFSVCFFVCFVLFCFVFVVVVVVVVVVLSSQCQVKVPTQADFYQLNVSCNACLILKKGEFLLPKSLRRVL